MKNIEAGAADSSISSLNPEWEIPSFTVRSFTEKKTRYCIVIPVLNEAERIHLQLDRMHRAQNGLDIILVDGQSTDGSIQPEELSKQGVSFLLTKTGPGRLSAQLRIGFAYAMHLGYEGIIGVDGNNKDGPEAIPEFLRYLEAGYDYVQGSRFLAGAKEENTPFLRKAGIRFLHAPLTSMASGFHYTDSTNGFRAYSRRYLLDSRVQPFRNIFSDYELHAYLIVRAPQLGMKVREIPVERKYPIGPVPTKISFVRGNWNVLKCLLGACLGAYAPVVKSTE